jgi:hypothetical protein
LETLIETENVALKRVWNQKDIPVVLRRVEKGEQLRVRLPFSTQNRVWLSTLGKSRPNWEAELECWEIPKIWFNNFVNQSLKKYSKLYVIQPYVETEICAQKCRDANGHDCQCSCMGQNHGIKDGTGWFDITETFAVRKGDERLACRLMRLKSRSTI